MKKSIISLILLTGIVLGQEFPFGNHYAERFTTNPHTSEVYYRDYFSTGGNPYFKANLRTMTVAPSEFSCLPIFSYKTQKMVYSKNDTLHLVDLDRKNHKKYLITDSLGYNEEESNMFSTNGESVILNRFVYSFKDSSLKRINFTSWPLKIRWSSDSTFLVAHQNPIPTIDFIVEYSTNSLRKDTVFVFNHDTYVLQNSGWDYDAKRNKLFYSTHDFGPVIFSTPKLHMYDRATRRDTVLFEYPKDRDTNCPAWGAGTNIREVICSGNYDKVAFMLDFYVGVSASNISVYWPDANKITRVTSGCMHYASKGNITWANDDTIIYCDGTRMGLYGYRVPGLTAIEQGDGLPLPSGYALANYPNPFNPATTISYSLLKAGNVMLKVYDVLGKEVACLVNEYKGEGNHTVVFDASKLSSGVYVYQLRSNDVIISKKMALTK